LKKGNVVSQSARNKDTAEMRGEYECLNSREVRGINTRLQLVCCAAHSCTLLVDKEEIQQRAQELACLFSNVFD